MATGYVEEKFESLPGNETNTPTLSTKVLTAPYISFKPDLNPSPMERDDENRNTDEPVPVLEDAHDPAWSSESRMYPDVLGFALKAMLGAPTTTAGNGVITDPDSVVIPTGATRHVWTAPFGPTGASPQTRQIQVAYSDQGVYFKLKGAATESLQISSPEKGGCRLQASGKAAYLARVSSPGVTPDYESLSVRPFSRGNLTLPTWLSGTGTHEDFSLTIAQGVEMVRSLGIASYFPDVVEKGEGPILITGSVPQRQLDADDFDALKAATGFSAVARWLSASIIASGYPYKFYTAFNNAQYVGGEMDALMNKRRHGGSFNFKATRNSAASVVFTLVNATASYA